MDVWVRPSPDNARRVHAALVAFGAPADRLSSTDFTQPDIVVQIGVPPLRIDILTSISGVQFEAAWAARQNLVLEGIVVPVLSRQHLLANKRASGRAKDLLDLKWLEGDGEEADH